jgi:hypothetical protein
MNYKNNNHRYFLIPIYISRLKKSTNVQSNNPGQPNIQGGNEIALVNCVDVIFSFFIHFSITILSSINM